MKGLIVRCASTEDLKAITEIYNEAILKTVATFDTEPKTLVEQKRWFENHGGRYPVLVAEMDGKIVGWGSLSKWSDRCAYADTVEDSVYVKEEFQGRGIGRQLLEALLIEGKKAGIRTVIARITEGNEISVHLHESLGFKKIGTMKEVGRKFGKLLDVLMMQKIF